jgi:exonuclease III
MTTSNKYKDVMGLEDETPGSESSQLATGEEQRQRLNQTRTNEVPRPKPTGSLDTDVTGNEKRSTSFVEKQKIGTWNVRSMYEGKLEVVTREMRRKGTQLLGISEMRWAGKGHFQFEDHKVFYSGHERSKANGVAFICNKNVAAAVLGYNPISDRVITIRISGKPVNITFIQAYAPTAAAEEDERESFYSTLQQAIEDTPKGDILIIMGDMNAKVGECEASVSTGNFGLGIRNEAGERLIEFCEVNNMKIMNTVFKQHRRRQYTWTSPDGRHRNQIDYIIIHNRWRSSIQSVRTLPGADCGTDHELLVAGVRVRIKKLKRSFIPMRYDMGKLLRTPWM